ncbi:LysR family transcriptional regulator [Streptomyces sp. SBR177]
MNDIELRHLRSFLAVARERSLTGAGAVLHLTQQAVSAHVRHLERALGVALLVRTSRGVLLTAAGRNSPPAARPSSTTSTGWPNGCAPWPMPRPARCGWPAAPPPPRCSPSTSPTRSRRRSPGCA